MDWLKVCVQRDTIATYRSYFPAATSAQARRPRLLRDDSLLKASVLPATTGFSLSFPPRISSVIGMNCQHIMRSRGLWNCTVSVCLSVCLFVCPSVCLSNSPAAAACGGFATVGPAGRTYRLIAAWPWQARSSKCKQCHVYSWRKGSWTHIFLSVSFW